MKRSGRTCAEGCCSDIGIALLVVSSDVRLEIGVSECFLSSLVNQQACAFLKNCSIEFLQPQDVEVTQSLEEVTWQLNWKLEYFQHLLLELLSFIDG